MVGVALVVGLGPTGAWASVTFTSGLTVSERYSDNVFFSPTDQRSDLATVVVPGAALVFEGQDLTFAARYGLTAEYHHVEKSANGMTQSVGVDLEVPFLSKQNKRTDVRVRESMTYTTELPAFSLGENDTATESNQGIQVPRTNTFRNSAGAAVTYGWSPRWRTTLAYENVLTRYSGDLQDATVNSGSLETTHGLSPRTTAGLGLSVSRQEYDGADSVTSWATTAQVSHRLTSTASLDGRVGVAISSSSEQSTTQSAVWVFDVSARKSLETVNTRVGYIREIGSGAGLIASATVSDRLSGGATWSLSRTVSANIDLAWAKNVSVPEASLTIYTYAGTTGISVALADWLRVSAGYEHLTQKARGLVGSDGNRNAVMLTITATGPSWRVVK